MIKQKPTRQRLRGALLLFSLLLFPITLNYFSPYLIMMGASERCDQREFSCLLRIVPVLVVSWHGCGAAGSALQELWVKSANPLTINQSTEKRLIGSSGSSGFPGLR